MEKNIVSIAIYVEYRIMEAIGSSKVKIRSPAGPRHRRKRTHAVNARIRFLRLVVSSHKTPTP